MPIQHIDVLRTPIGIIYFSLIRDKANMVEPRKGPIVDLQLLSENSENTVEKS